MDSRVLILIGVIGVYGLRFSYTTFLRKQNIEYLIVSLFVFLLPFTINLSHFPSYPEVRSGAFNQTFGLEPYLFFLAGLFLYAIFIRNKVGISSFGKNVVLTLLMLFLFSYFNPVNIFSFQTFLFFTRLLLFTGVFVLISQVFKREIVFQGIYDGFAGLVILQFITALAFPILGIKEVTNLFFEGAMYWAVDSRGGRNSAIGVFGHPGNLALFLTVCIALFYSFFLHNIRKRLSLSLLIISVFTLFLSLSRSGLLAFIVSFPIMFFVYRKPERSIFSLKNILLFGLVSILMLGIIIIFTPIGAYFQGDNFAEMGEARMIHWVAGYQAFISNPIIGVGINTHISYFAEMLPILDGFYARSPIHNIHMIILCEIGLIGIVLWFVFMFKTMQYAQNEIVTSANRYVSALNLSLIGIIVSYSIYGLFGWAPFANEQLAIFFLIYFFASTYRNRAI